VFEPRFAIEGALLALAGRQFIRAPADRRRWTVCLIVGIVAIDLFGSALSLGGVRFAIS
jgi:hypothetical protein